MQNSQNDAGDTIPSPHINQPLRGVVPDAGFCQVTIQLHGIFDMTIAKKRAILFGREMQRVRRVQDGFRILV